MDWDNNNLLVIADHSVPRASLSKAVHTAMNEWLWSISQVRDTRVSRDEPEEYGQWSSSIAFDTEENGEMRTVGFHVAFVQANEDDVVGIRLGPSNHDAESLLLSAQEGLVKALVKALRGLTDRSWIFELSSDASWDVNELIGIRLLNDDARRRAGMRLLFAPADQEDPR